MTTTEPITRKWDFEIGSNQIEEDMMGLKRGVVITGISLGVLGGGAGWAAEKPKPAAEKAPQTPDLSKEVLARVGDRVITVEDFRKMLAPAEKDAKKKATQEQQKAFLENLVQNLLLLQEAQRLKLHERTEVRHRIEEATLRILVEEYLKEEVVGKSKVDNREVRAFWESHQQEFTTPLQIRARHILFKAEGGEEKARKRAEETLAKIHAGADFAKLAEEISEDDTTKGEGGNLGYFGEGKMVPSFEKLAFSLKPGEVGGPVKTPFGYHLIRVEDRREPTLKPFAMVREPLRLRLERELKEARTPALLEELWARYQVQVHAGLLDVDPREQGVR
jgi:peptidyl-prolyl cis-trans isomerase C